MNIFTIFATYFKIYTLINLTQKNIPEALSEYHAYDTQYWRRDYFNHDNGGYLVTHRQRIARSHISKNETAKFTKELNMAIAFAQHGFRMELLEELPGVSSPDVTINGIFAELKRLYSHNNIIRGAKKAVHKQGAEILLFQFDNETDAIHKELEALKRLNIRACYFFTGRELYIYAI
jgi:hypothetical protein